MKFMFNISSLSYLKILLFFLILIVGIDLRFYFATLGANYDVESYKIVADIVSRGGNVYAETTRYNYGPIWSWILSGIKGISLLMQNSPEVFRYSLTVILTGVDICIFTILNKKYNLKVASLYFLNPISFIITGYYSQFDNFAILFGILAMLVKSSRLKGGKFWVNIWTALLLGVSISLKQLLMFFPLWFFFREKRMKAKLIYLVIPYFVFLILFIPYLSPDGTNGILQNVFMYKSFRNTYFTNIFLFGLNDFVVAMLILLGVLAIAAIALRKNKSMEYLFMYCFLLLLFAPSFLPYYIVLALPIITLRPNPFFIIFSLFAGFLLCLDGIGPSWQPLLQFAPRSLLYSNIQSEPFHFAYIFLMGGFLWMVNDYFKARPGIMDRVIKRLRKGFRHDSHTIPTI